MAILLKTLYYRKYNITFAKYHLPKMRKAVLNKLFYKNDPPFPLHVKEMKQNFFLSETVISYIF